MRVLAERADRSPDLMFGQATLIRQILDGREFLMAKDTEHDVSSRSPLGLYGLLKGEWIESIPNGKEVLVVCRERACPRIPTISSSLELLVVDHAMAIGRLRCSLEGGCE